MPLAAEMESWRGRQAGGRQGLETRLGVKNRGRACVWLMTDPSSFDTRPLARRHLARAGEERSEAGSEDAALMPPLSAAICQTGRPLTLTA